MAWMRGALLLSVVLCACGSGTADGDCAHGEALVEGRCVPAETSCEEGLIRLLDGTCAPVGVPPDGCAEGFRWNDGACEPILPAEPCPPGMMALPGETACRPIMECPSEPWGGIDGGASPEWVDASYAGNDSDGSQARPWTTIAEAIANAAPGSVIGIAAGIYPGNLAIGAKPLHLRGTCPAEVVVKGVVQGNDTPAIILTGAGASGTSLTGLSVTGPSAAVSMSGTQDVQLDRLWLHDTGGIGLDVEDPLGATSATLTDSLIEASTGRGALALGTSLHITRSVVRGCSDDGVAPSGIHATVSNYSGMPATVTVDHAVIRDNHGVGIFAVGSTVALDASVVAANRAVEEGRGYGLSLQDDLDTGLRAEASVTRSVLSGNTLAGINALASDLHVEATTITDTLRWIDPASGTPLDDGRGLNLQDGQMGGPSTVEVVASTITRTQGLGSFAAGSELHLQDSRIGETIPGELESGRGINLQPATFGSGGSVATLSHCLVSASEQFGIFVGESELTLDQSAVRDVVPAGELAFGDAVTAIGATGSVAIVDSRLAHSARAGLSLFGASASMSGSVLSCHPIDIAVQDLGAQAADLTDGGSNTCGCDGEEHDCKAKSTDLEPPSPL